MAFAARLGRVPKVRLRLVTPFPRPNEEPGAGAPNVQSTSGQCVLQRIRLDRSSAARSHSSKQSGQMRCSRASGCRLRATLDELPRNCSPTTRVSVRRSTASFRFGSGKFQSISNGTCAWNILELAFSCGPLVNRDVNRRRPGVGNASQVGLRIVFGL
jgi:hypothetical protein